MGWKSFISPVVDAFNAPAKFVGEQTYKATKKITGSEKAASLAARMNAVSMDALGGNPIPFRPTLKASDVGADPTLFRSGRQAGDWLGSAIGSLFFGGALAGGAAAGGGGGGAGAGAGLTTGGAASTAGGAIPVSSATAAGVGTGAGAGATAAGVGAGAAGAAAPAAAAPAAGYGSLASGLLSVGGSALSAYSQSQAAKAMAESIANQNSANAALHTMTPQEKAQYFSSGVTKVNDATASSQGMLDQNLAARGLGGNAAVAPNANLQRARIKAIADVWNNLINTSMNMRAGTPSVAAVPPAPDYSTYFLSNMANNAGNSLQSYGGNLAGKQMQKYFG